MKIEGDALVLEGQEVFAFNRLYSHLMANVGIQSAMKRTWAETDGLPVDSRAAVATAALRTFSSYLLVRALRKDLHPLAVYDSAMEQAKVILAPEKNPSQGDRALEGGRIPSSSDPVVVAVTTPRKAQISAKLKPTGRFKMALELSRTLRQDTD